jgi:hypothetical protein
MSALDRWIALALTVVGFVTTLAITMPKSLRVSGHGIEQSTQSEPLQYVRREPRVTTARLIAARAEPPAGAASVTRDLPVQLYFQRVRGSLHRGGQLVTSSGQPLLLVVEISNAQTDKRDEHTIALNPRTPASVGETEGWSLDSGDQVKLHADGYADLVRSVP